MYDSRNGDTVHVDMNCLFNKVSIIEEINVNLMYFVDYFPLFFENLTMLYISGRRAEDPRGGSVPPDAQPRPRLWAHRRRGAFQACSKTCIIADLLNLYKFL